MNICWLTQDATLQIDTFSVKKNNKKIFFDHFSGDVESRAPAIRTRHQIVSAPF